MRRRLLTTGGGALPEQNLRGYISEGVFVIRDNFHSYYDRPAFGYISPVNPCKIDDYNNWKLTATGLVTGIAPTGLSFPKAFFSYAGCSHFYSSDIRDTSPIYRMGYRFSAPVMVSRIVFTVFCTKDGHCGYHGNDSWYDYQTDFSLLGVDVSCSASILHDKFPEQTWDWVYNTYKWPYRPEGAPIGEQFYSWFSENEGIPQTVVAAANQIFLKFNTPVLFDPGRSLSIIFSSNGAYCSSGVSHANELQNIGIFGTPLT